MSTSRRDFLADTGRALLAAIGAPALRTRSGNRAAVIVRGGTVFDGVGAPGIEADVAIDGGRITTVASRIAGAGVLEIDARGLAVAPGFVDIHSHADGTLFADPALESVIRQGITTVVVGADGGSPAPSGTPPRGSGTGDSPRFATLRDFFTAVDRLPPAANVACMVGLGTVRGTVVGLADRRATGDEIRRMLALVQGALADGACGASSGLEYPPGAFAPREELVALCRPLAARWLPYATHLRNEDDHLLEAVDEGIAVAEGARCALHISHLKTQGPRNWGRLDDVFARLHAAATRGLDASFDRYPYTAYWTGLSNLFPVWSRDGGPDAFLARLADPATAQRIRTAVLAKVGLIGGWDNVMISSVAARADSLAEGARLGAYAAAQRTDPYETAVQLLRDSRADVGMVGFAMSEQNLERILANTRSMVASDGGAVALSGPARQGHPHPRSLGAFPRVLARYVRERHVLSLPEAVRKMTSLPATRLRLSGRGRIAPGAAADLVIFDPSTVTDRATFTDPFAYPAGITAVLVNGAPVLLNGQRTPARPGQSLRPMP